MSRRKLVHRFQMLLAILCAAIGVYGVLWRGVDVAHSAATAMLFFSLYFTASELVHRGSRMIDAMFRRWERSLDRRWRTEDGR